MQHRKLIHAVDPDRRCLDTLASALRPTTIDVSTHTRAGAFLDSLDRCQPGCLITELSVPDMDGLVLQQTLIAQQVTLPVIFLASHGETGEAVTALKRGAVDFLEKPVRPTALLDSVRDALARDDDLRKRTHERCVARDRYASLTPRERQVFGLVVADYTSKCIARRLQISPRTVEHHRERVMLKMKAASLADLITLAVLCGVHELHLQP